jgi:hypothetical protein
MFQDISKKSEFSLRCKELKVGHNTFLGRVAKLRMRFTSDMGVYANWFEVCDGTSCRCRNHRLRWNPFEKIALKRTPQLKLEAGNMDIEKLGDPNPPATKRPRARDCLLIGNRGGGAVVGI